MVSSGAEQHKTLTWQELRQRELSGAREERPRVVVVEDEDLARSLLSKVLSLEGYEVDCFSDGLEALRYLEGAGSQGGCVDLLLSDVRMPRMGGIALLRKARALDARLPVVLMSAYGDRLLLREAIRLHVSGFLDKPIDTGELLSVVQDALRPERRELTRPGVASPSRWNATPRKQIGHYEIVEEIGRGAAGVVYRGWQQDLSRSVAIKVSLPAEARRERIGARFRQEARAMAKLRHPNIVVVHEIGEHQGANYIVMEFVRGVDLRKLLRRTSLAPARALRLFLPIAEALAYAHANGVLHRDVKPANIVIPDLKQPVLVDFGIALTWDGEFAPDLDYMLGTPSYMAPDYISGSHRFDETCEVFSLGAVLYEALAGSGCLPRELGGPLKTLTELIEFSRRPTRPIETRVELPRRLSELVNAMLAPRSGRVQTMEAVVERLQELLKTEAFTGE